MKNICVFCGSKKGNDPAYEKAASNLGHLLADAGYNLVYGGGKVGLMGALADAVLANGGKVTGVIPQFLLDLEVGHTGITELVVVDSMHTRKQKMATLSDAFIAMPGGYGTLEELAEILTWTQLDIITKPVTILNINGYYDSLLSMMDEMVKKGFLPEQNRSLLNDFNAPEQLLHYLSTSSSSTEQKNLDLT